MEGFVRLCVHSSVRPFIHSSFKFTWSLSGYFQIAAGLFTDYSVKQCKLTQSTCMSNVTVSFHTCSAVVNEAFQKRIIKRLIGYF